MCVTRVMTAVLLMASGVFAQTPTNPLPSPIEAVDGLLGVRFVEFATLPERDGEAAVENNGCVVWRVTGLQPERRYRYEITF